MILQEALKTFLGWLVMLPGFYLTGSVFGRFLSEEDQRLRGIFYTAAGLMGLSFYLVLAANFGQFNAGAVALFFGLVFAFRWRELPGFTEWISSILRYPWESERSLFDRTLSVIFYGTVLFTFCFSLLPETGNDALCYQLNVPKQFLWQGSLMPLEYDANSYMPMAMNLLYAVGLMFKSIGITKLFHAITGLLLTYVIALKIESLTGNLRAARFTALMFWLAPVVVNEITTTYLDVASGFFLVIAFLWICAAVRREKLGMVFMAGLAAGMTIAVKFSLLISIPVLTFVGFWRWIRALHFKKAAIFISVFAGATMLGCGYWFVRNFILTGNPTFPYFGEIFNTIGFKNYSTYMDMGIPKTLLNFILLPLQLTLNPKPFDHHFWVGPYLLLSIPAVFFSFKIKEARPYLGALFLLTGVWFLTTHANRYLVPILPFWYIAAGTGLPLLMGELKMRLGLGVKFARLTAAALTCCLIAAGSYHYRMQFGVLAGRWTHAEYLGRMERSFPAAEWANQHLPENARILNVEEIRQYYFDRRMVRESILYFFTNYTDKRQPIEVLSFLKKQGFTHVMNVEGPSRNGVLPRVAEFLKILKNPEWFQFLETVRSENIREDRLNYTFYSIR